MGKTKKMKGYTVCSDCGEVVPSSWVNRHKAVCRKRKPLSAHAHLIVAKFQTARLWLSFR